MRSRDPRPDARADSLKRVVDVIVAGGVLVMTAPIQLAVASVVAVHLGRPILFRQMRVGRNGQVFTLVKFRTMRPVDAPRAAVADADRLSRVGQWMRSTSLDELPTLWNVVKGDMSLVGPRPLLVEYLDRYTPAQARRHEVRPGVTGLAQVRGRNALAWERKFEYDVLYVDRRSAWVDLRILIATVRSVLLREGISHDGHATMTTFGERGAE